MQPIHITSKDDLIEQIKLYTDKLIIFMFTASWCGPCKSIKKVIYDNGKGLSVDFTNAVFFYIDVDENDELSHEFEVNSMPTFFINKVGSDNKLHQLEMFKGADKNKLITCLTKQY